jgi:hypothetical protein
MLDSWKNMFSHWTKAYSGTFQDKATFKRILQATPKFVCWEIWPNMNGAIFNQKVENPSSVVTKSKGFLAKHLKSTSRQVNVTQNLSEEEEE